MSRALTAIEADSVVPFRLEQLPLFRCAIYRVGPEEHVVGFVIHHIISDGWSLGVLAAEVSAHYRARFEQGPPSESLAPVQQIDYAIWHRELVDGHLLDGQLEYWRRQLADLQPFELVSEHPRSDPPPALAATIVAEMPADLERRLERFCLDRQMSPFEVELAAFHSVLALLTGEHDIAVATPVANRNWLEGETVISSLVNTLVIRSKVLPNQRLSDVVQDVHTAVVEAFENQDLPFARLVSELGTDRRSGHGALTTVFFSVTDRTFEPPSLPAVDVEVLPVNRRHAQFDISLSVDAFTTRQARLEYRAELFDPTRMERLLADYLSVLEQFVDDPSRSVRDLSIVSSANIAAESHDDKRVGVLGSSIEPTSRHEAPRPGTESLIADAWCRVLGVSLPGRHDNFFDEGGHSLLTLRLVAGIERTTGRRLAISDIFRAPTIAALSSIVDHGDSDRRWTSLVPVQPIGDKRPFFYVAPFLVTSLSFSNLARAMGREQPLYVLQPQGMDTPDPVHDSIESMAAHYVNEMRTVQPTGPYLVGGHCTGATVAFEMTRQLRAEGDDVGVLVLVDAEPPHVERPGSRRGFGALKRLDAYRRDGRLADAVAWSSRVMFERIVIRRFGRGRRRALAELRARHAGAHARYRPGRVDAAAVLIRSKEWDTPENDWHFGWIDLLDGGVETVSVPGTHAGLVAIEHSGPLADAINNAIAHANPP